MAAFTLDDDGFALRGRSPRPAPAVTMPGSLAHSSGSLAPALSSAPEFLRCPALLYAGPHQQEKRSYFGTLGLTCLADCLRFCIDPQCGASGTVICVIRRQLLRPLPFVFERTDHCTALTYIAVAVGADLFAPVSEIGCAYRKRKTLEFRRLGSEIVSK
jgi:hypothetical protein